MNMQRALYGVLILNLLFEGWIAFVLISMPFRVADFDASQQWAVHYGFAALVIAGAIGWIWRFGTAAPALGALLGVLMTFHLGLAISSAIMYSFGAMFGPAVVHLVFAVAFLAFFLNREHCLPR